MKPCFYLAKFEAKHGDKVYSLSTYPLQPSHWSFTIIFLFVHLLIVNLLCNCKHSSSLCGPTVSPSSYSCGFHTHFSSTIHKQTCCHTHKHMQFLYQYTASTTQVSGVESVPLTGGQQGQFAPGPQCKGGSKQCWICSNILY